MTIGQRVKVGHRKNMAMCEKMLTLLVISVGIISIVNAGGETLVLLDNLAIKETHSMFFKSLQGWFFIVNCWHKLCRFS
jgi:hypothetical protein